MSFLTTLLTCILGAVSVAFAQEEGLQALPIFPRMSTAALTALRRRVEGCNANICFAIDGSNSINASEFQAQTFFVLDVISVVGAGGDVEAAAVQYGNRNSVISRLTSDLDRFNLAVSGATQRGGGSALRRSISFCTRQLRRRSGEPMNMVLLGDGNVDRPRAAVRRANRFRDFGGDVFVVGAGVTNSERLLALAGGNADRVYEVDSFLDVLEIQLIVEDMVIEICGAEETEI